METWRDVPAGHFLYKWRETLNFLDDYQFEEFLRAEIEAWKVGAGKESAYAIREEKTGKVGVICCDPDGKFLGGGYCDLPYDLAVRALDTMMTKIFKNSFVVPPDLFLGRRPPSA